MATARCLSKRLMELGGEPAARTSQPVITGLGEDAALGFLLQVVVLTGPGRMLMGAADRGIDAKVPRDRPLRIGLGLEPGEDPLPGAVPLPSAEHFVDPASRSVVDGEVPPRDTDPDSKPYAVYQPPPRSGPELVVTEAQRQELVRGRRHRRRRVRGG